MQIPQVIIVEEVLPEVRRRTAKTLYSSGWPQSRIADLLGTSQAMVSKYLKDSGKIAPSLGKMVDAISDEMEVAALAGETRDDLVERLCIALDRSMQGGDLKERYMERFGMSEVPHCFGPCGPGPTRARVLEDLQLAVQFLMDNPIMDLVPGVKVNLAYALPGASSKDDVAAFPGRIPDSNGRMLRPLFPEFGASEHLAGVLLDAAENTSGIMSAMNLRVTDTVIDMIMRRKGVGELDMGSRTGREHEEDINIHYSVHPGDFGIEPCLYLFSSSPLLLSRFAVDLQREIDKEVKKDG